MGFVEETSMVNSNNTSLTPIVPHHNNQPTVYTRDELLMMELKSLNALIVSKREEIAAFDTIIA